MNRPTRGGRFAASRGGTPRGAAPGKLERGSSGRGTRPPKPSRARKQMLRPPFAPALVLGAIVLSGLFALATESRDSNLVHFAAALLGMFGSVMVFGWFRIVVNSRSSSGSFSDWGFVSSAATVRGLLMLAWGLGSVNLFQVVYEFARSIKFGG